MSQRGDAVLHGIYTQHKKVAIHKGSHIAVNMWFSAVGVPLQSRIQTVVVRLCTRTIMTVHACGHIYVIFVARGDLILFPVKP